MTSISKSDKILVLGSCFAGNMGKLLKDRGYDVCINPFGTIFNPESIANSIDRLKSGKPFEPCECIEMGAGAGKICSFCHHTSFARTTAEEFLEKNKKEAEESKKLEEEELIKRDKELKDNKPVVEVIIDKNEDRVGYEEYKKMTRKDDE